MEREIINEDKIFNIFSGLKVTKRQIKLVIDLTEYSVSVIRVSKLNIELDFKYNIKIDEFKQAELTFQSNDKLYHCETDIIEINPGRNILLTFPLTIVKWQKRKYPRVAVDNVYINFKLITKPDEITINPGVPFKLKQIYKSLYSEHVDIKKIFGAINQEIASHSVNGQLILHKQGEKLSTNVLIAGKYKKAIAIPDTSNPASYTRDIKSSFYMSYKPFFDERGWSTVKQDVEIKRLINFFLVKKIQGFIIIPLLLQNKMIGHLFCIGKKNDPYIFGEDNIFFLKSLCDLAAEAVARMRFISLYSSTDTKFPVIDISVGGLLFEVQGGIYLLKLLNIGSGIRIFLDLNDVPLNISGIIKRIDYLENAFRVAVEYNLNHSEEILVNAFVSKRLNQK